MVGLATTEIHIWKEHSPDGLMPSSSRTIILVAFLCMSFQAAGACPCGRHADVGAVEGVLPPIFIAGSIIHSIN